MWSEATDLTLPTINGVCVALGPSVVCGRLLVATRFVGRLTPYWDCFEGKPNSNHPVRDLESHLLLCSDGKRTRRPACMSFGLGNRSLITGGKLSLSPIAIQPPIVRSRMLAPFLRNPVRTFRKASGSFRKPPEASGSFRKTYGLLKLRGSGREGQGTGKEGVRGRRA